MLGVSADTLLQKFESGGRSVLLKRSLQPARKQALTQILRRGSLLHGFNIAYNSKRYYPQKEIAASVVGYTNHKNDGTAGIEFTRHSSLQSVDGREAGIRARAGGRLNEVLALPPQNGGNITLSIDSRLQFYAHDILQKAMHRHGARAAAAAVMDAQTGDVLALASVPGFNPNNIGPGAREKITPSPTQWSRGRLQNRLLSRWHWSGGRLPPMKCFPPTARTLSAESK